MSLRCLVVVGSWPIRGTREGGEEKFRGGAKLGCFTRCDGDEKPTDQRRSGDDLFTAAMVVVWSSKAGERTASQPPCCIFICEKRKHMAKHPSRRCNAGGEKAASVGERAETVTTAIT